MLNVLKLLAPALIPSWRFFKEVAPSPRIEFALLKAPGDPPRWAEARSRPDHVSGLRILRRMLWNPRWNETLFMVSCAERLMDAPTAHSEAEIRRRIARDLYGQTGWLTFRLVFVAREGAAMTRSVEYVSPPAPLVDAPDAPPLVHPA